MSAEGLGAVQVFASAKKRHEFVDSGDRHGELGRRGGSDDVAAVHE
jgi:hypothetical protein